MKKTIIFIVILLVLGALYYYFFANKPSVSTEEDCRALARSEYQQGIISGPDAIGIRMEQCLIEYGIDPNI